MKTKIISLLFALLLALPAGVPALAAQRIALTGTEHMFITGAPGRVWVADGWVQQREVALTGTFDFGVMSGTETQLANARLNPVTGEGHVWGMVTYTDSATGVVCSGVREGQLTNFLLTARIVAPCSDGSLLRGTLQDTLINFPPGSPVPSDVYSEFSGELLSP
jgi:hypothetical protein